MEHVNHSFDLLTSRDLLHRGRFHIPCTDHEKANVSTDIVEEDEVFADLQWRLSSASAVARFQRLVYLYGWPHRWNGALKDGDSEALIMNKFHEDYNVSLPRVQERRRA